ncbi:MAG TPA: PP2C family protein-serine/threonine phosphatase, partial [Vicinamibacteria bacterium]|nr:PP2C family protein-serine/threonine phosphatase [Vicinamibacteria bacterium]
TAGRRRRRSRRLDDDAREMQRGLLVRAIPPVKGYDIGVAWSAAEDLGGDAYAVSALPGGRLGLAIADGCGKGTPAALLMANAQATLDDLMAAARPPAEVCARLGRALGRRLSGGRFVSLAYAVLDRAAASLAYCNAGHPPPLLLRGGGPRRLDRGGPVLGPVAQARYEEGVLPLEPGDRLVLFTDGILEAGPDGAGGEELGETRLLAHLQAMRSAHAAEAAAAVLAAARDFAGGRLGDDATVVVADVAP